MDLVLSGVQKGHGALVVSVASTVAASAVLIAAAMRPKHEANIADLPSHAQVPVKILSRFRKHGPDEFDAYVEALLNFGNLPEEHFQCSWDKCVAFTNPNTQPVWEAMAGFYHKLHGPADSARVNAQSCLLIWTRIALVAITRARQDKKNVGPETRDGARVGGVAGDGAANRQ